MRPLRRVVALLACLLALAGQAACSTGSDAAVHGGTFTFVSPGGKYAFSYPPDQRQRIGELSGPNLMTDDTIALSDFAGKVVVINFWGSWCPPCREEQPGLNLISQDLAPSGVQFVGIALQKGSSQSAGQDYYRSFNVPYPSIYDPTMRTILSLRGYPSGSIPSTIVLDRQHRVAQIWLLSAEEPIGTMKARIAAIAAEKDRA